ncbi:MAG: acetyl-CoA C-acyltransferase [Chitinophagales bacterium]|nr:acetyl-CoA C-acyltransferase [Chitinophagales bacterium]
MRKVVIIEGTRTPFAKSGTDYADLMSYQLASYAIKGLLIKTGIDPKLIDRVIMGNVISNIQTSNVAREASLMAGIPYTSPCNTVTQACISANRAICDGYAEIAIGKADIIIAGGVENSSDTPIGFRKPMRKKLFNAQKLRGIGDTLKFIFSLRPSDFYPEKPAIAEFLTGRTMGLDCDILASKWHASRAEQDIFAVRSHQLAAAGFRDNILQQEITEVSIAPNFVPVKVDNGIRGDTSIEKMAGLKPAFDKKHGTLTAANSSFLTDGAACVLMMSEDKALELGYTPKASIYDYVFTGSDLENELLLGPAYATAKILTKNKMSLSDIDVFEYHEAFAGQIISNMNALNSDEFAREKLGLEKKIGTIPLDKMNIHGGSLSIGHPFGATGARLVTTAMNRLERENGRFALIAACAAGAHGNAIILERYTKN